VVLFIELYLMMEKSGQISDKIAIFYPFP